MDYYDMIEKEEDIYQGQDLDLTILQSISGVEDPLSLPGEIEDGYLAREYFENQREQGFEVPEERRPSHKSAKERRLWKSTKDMERCEGERVNPMESSDKDRREEAQKRKGWPQREYEDNRLPHKTVKI